MSPSPTRLAVTASALLLGISACTTSSQSTTTTTAQPTNKGTTTTRVPAPTVPPAEIETSATRPFRMGFTTWPYDFDAEAVDWTWATIEDHSDLIAIHLDNGVPWQESADGTPFPKTVQATLADAAARSARFDRVYVAVTPQHNDRATIARSWDDRGSQQPLPPTWEGRALDDPEVIDAYLGYARRIIDALDPDYFAYGIEVNAGYLPGGDSHTQMLRLAAAVYPALKAEYPYLPVFLTFQVGSWVSTDAELMEITKSLLPYTDLVGLSAYPYLDFADPFRAAAAPEPVAEWMDRFATLGKPIAVTETGYAAEPLVIPSIGIDTENRAEWQAEYVEDLLASASRTDAEFVVYWEVRDYDDAYEFLLTLDIDPALVAIWRDIGLYDGTGSPRPALGVWDAWLEVPLG